MVISQYIPYGRQNINDLDIDAVVSVLKSDFLTQGNCVPAFEKAISDYCGVKHGVAVNSATSALHIACLSLGLGVGDWLWTSPISFVASANCGLYCGAQVDFVDIDPNNLNMCPSKLEKKLVQASEQNKLPKIVVAVHFSGNSCDMQRIRELSEKYEFALIEDASHAIGGTYKNKKIGSCQFSDVTVFSFHPVKIITSAEGGMALTNDTDLAESMSSLRSHGITRDPKRMLHEKEGDWYYQQLSLGFNYRLNDIQAALGLSQLKRIDDFVSTRNFIAERYNEEFSRMGLKFQKLTKGGYSAYHLYTIQFENAEQRSTVFKFLRAKNIGVNVHYIPIHLQPYYKNTGLYCSEDLTNAEDYYQRAISIPIFPALTTSQQIRVINEISNALKL